MNTQIYNEVCQFLEDNEYIKAEDVTPSLLLNDYLGMDSLDLIDMAVRFETRYSIRIFNEYHTGTKTVAEFVDMIDGKVNDKK